VYVNRKAADAYPLPHRRKPQTRLSRSLADLSPASAQDHYRIEIVNRLRGK